MSDERAERRKRKAVARLAREFEKISAEFEVPPADLFGGLLRRGVGEAPAAERATLLGQMILDLQLPAEQLVSQPPHLGSQPIERRYRGRMVWLASVLDYVFNGRVGGRDRGTGYVLLAFPFGDHGGRCNYLSNGVDRRDIVVLFRDQIRRFEGAPDIEGRA